MTPSNIFFYLFESSVCLILLMLVYKLFLNYSTHFQENRVYLLGSLWLSILIPLLPIPFLLNESVVISRLTSDYERANTVLSRAMLAFPTQANLEADTIHPLLNLFVWVYGLGFLYQSWRLFSAISLVARLQKRSQMIRKESFYTIYQQEELPTFSFLHWIFIDNHQKLISDEELAQVVQHEQVHVKQKHTLDLLFIEIVSLFFWFNPAIPYLKKPIKFVHEYLVDAEVTKKNDSKKYAQLLVKLALQQNNLSILNTISNNRTLNRIAMLSKLKSSPLQKLKLLLALPALAITVVLCSFLAKPPKSTSTLSFPPTKYTQGKGSPIQKISWRGNKIFSEAQLTQALGLKKGDVTNAEDIAKRIDAFEPSSVASLYMDNGYLFFMAKPQAKNVKNGLEVDITIFEGEQVRVNDIIVKGNKKVATELVMSKIDIQKGKLFSRAKIIKAQQILAEMGPFNPKNIGINPLPKQTYEAGWVVDLEFVVEEK